MLVDNEAALKSVEVQTLVNKYNIIIGSLPPYLGVLFDICDNPIHGNIENFIDREQARFSRDISMDEKYEIYRRAYQSVDGETVAKAFAKSGLSNITSLESAKEKIYQVLGEGTYRKEKFMEEHVAQLEAYLNDCIDRGEPIPRGDYPNALSGPLWETYSDFIKLEDEINRNK